MSLFLIGGTNVMLCYWWHKCHILTIGGTNVAVGEMSWWDKCQVGQMSVGQMSVGQMSVGQKSRHHWDQLNLSSILFNVSDNTSL
jgi:hypothetical protein